MAAKTAASSVAESDVKPDGKDQSPPSQLPLVVVLVVVLLVDDDEEDPVVAFRRRLLLFSSSPSRDELISMISPSMTEARFDCHDAYFAATESAIAPLMAVEVTAV